jgi:hypothetical protein
VPQTKKAAAAPSADPSPAEIHPQQERPSLFLHPLPFNNQQSPFVTHQSPHLHLQFEILLPPAPPTQAPTLTPDIPEAYITLDNALPDILKAYLKLDNALPDISKAYLKLDNVFLDVLDVYFTNNNPISNMPNHNIKLDNTFWNISKVIIKLANALRDQWGISISLKASVSVSIWPHFFLHSMLPHLGSLKDTVIYVHDLTLEVCCKPICQGHRRQLPAHE